MSLALRSLARVLALALAVVSALPLVAAAQAPDEQWRTIETAHFHVHFPLALEPVARKAGGSAERAYERLAPLLRPSRGGIDLVVTDHVDYSNGFAYVSPSPRMVIFARPPVDDRTLRFRDDWLDLVIQHELVHVFHLDRTRGWWRVAQALFGRQPLLFPNAWDPSWLLEGLAVYYESKLGDGGRIEGMAHEQYVTARALDGPLPHIGQWSVASLDYPGGTNAYIYGSLFVQSMADRSPGGPGGVERFVERSSGRLNPFAFNGDADRAFGVSFSAQWQKWSDSVARAVRHDALADAPGATDAHWLTRFPRRTPGGHVLYLASDGRDVTGLYELSIGTNEPARRIARRNSMEPNVALADGRVIFAQAEWQDPWRYRSDVWIREADGREHALTHGARLFAPDARPRDGAIVAVQNVAGTTRLVRVDAAGAVTPITGASLDTNWSAPRWSPDGTQIVATRWTRGGIMGIAILPADATPATPAHLLVSARGVLDNPAWSLDGRSIVFAANVDGTSRLWTAVVASGLLYRGPSSVASLESPEPLGNQLMAIQTRGTGERLVVSPLAPPVESKIAGIPDTRPDLPAEPANGPVQSYDALRQLWPRYWLPSIATTDENRTRWGATITSDDIVGRHFYAATLEHEPQRGENTGSLVYRYSGLGLPLVDLAYEQTWDHMPLTDSTKAVIGTLGRRRRYIGTQLTLIRQRVRSVGVLAGGAQLELRDFVTDPAPLISRLSSPLYLQTLKYPTFSLFAGWGNTRQPILAIGPEDGVQLSGSAKVRWRTDDPSATRSATYIGTADLYKSLPFPGRAHQVFVLHGAVGVTDDKTNTELEAGGVSGGQVELAPGLLVGDSRRTFFVRGFDAGVQRGIRALGGSAEYRTPVAIPSWGTRFVPFFAQRVSLTVFGDAGAAWCPAGAKLGLGCWQGVTAREWISSAGAELVLDAAVLSYDTPYRFRLGYAHPLQGVEYARSSNGSIYFSLGASF